MNITKTEIYKMAVSRFGKVIGKKISEIKINSVPKNLCINTKTIIRLRLGDYYTIDAVFFVIHKPLYPIQKLINNS